MRREIGLIKLILKYVERNGTPDGRALNPPEFPDRTDEDIDYHMDLCAQAGYMTMERVQTRMFPKRLTWNGHEALDALRKDAS